MDETFFNLVKDMRAAQKLELALHSKLQNNWSVQ